VRDGDNVLHLVRVDVISPAEVRAVARRSTAVGLSYIHSHLFLFCVPCVH
jgi:hypothetical protein